MKPINNFFVAKHRALLRNVILVGSVLLSASATQAQTRFTSITAFGDSYIDHGVNLVPLLGGDTSNYPSHGADRATLLASSPLGYIAYPYALQNELGLSNEQLTNYGIGAATTTELSTQGRPLSLPFELATWGGSPFGPRDLVLINIGGNDAIRGIASGSPPGALGTQVGTTAAAAVEQFVDAGARNVVFTGFSSMANLPIVQAFGAVPYTDAFTATYYAALQENMRPLALAGARIFLIDQGLLSARIAANLNAYGFDSYTYAGPGVTSVFVSDGLHLSTEGYELGARYIANVLNAPSTYAAQGDVAQITTTGFAQSIFSHLDGGRSGGFGLATDRSMPARPFSLFASLTGSTGSRDNQADAYGLDYDTIGGQVGAEYRVSPNIKLGALFNYTSGQFDLNQSGAEIDQDAYQFGAYASLSYARWFADVMAIYGRGDLDIERAGIIDTVRGDTNSDSFAVGGKTAYLFDVAPGMQAGPLVGLTYVHSRVDAYTETGDPVLTFAVGSQNVDSLIGSAGAQVRFPFLMNGQTVSPYINVTADHDFRGDGRTITATLTQSPLLPIYTAVGGRGGETYGTVQAGLSAAISDRTLIDIDVASTFARSDGNDFAGSLTVRYGF